MVGGSQPQKAPAAGETTAQMDLLLQFVKTQAHIGTPTAHAVLEALTPAERDGSGDVDMGGGLGGQASGGPAGARRDSPCRLIAH